MTETHKKLSLLWPTLLTLIVLAILVSLGTWQMQRKTWKDGLIASLNARTTADPLSLENRAAIERWLHNDGTEYTKLAVHGVFDHDHERYLYAPHQKLGPGQHVYTPLRISNQRVIWINRGYIPQHLTSPEKRLPGQLPGTVEIVGLVRRPKPKGRYSPKNDVNGNAWYWPDLKAMHQSAYQTTGMQALPLFIDTLAQPQNPGGWPRGGTTIISFKNRHLGYAWTWYGLAATLLAVYTAFVLGRIRNRRAHQH